MGVELEISTSYILGNEVYENRSGRLSKKDRRYSQYVWRHMIITCRSFLTPDTMTVSNIAKAKNYDENEGKYYGRFNIGKMNAA
jgi:hypothetical protein